MTIRDFAPAGHAAVTAGIRRLTPPAAMVCAPHRHDLASRARAMTTLREEEQRIAVQIAVLEHRLAADGARMNRDACIFLKLLLRDRRGALLALQRRTHARI